MKTRAAFLLATSRSTILPYPSKLVIALYPAPLMSNKFRRRRREAFNEACTLEVLARKPGNVHPWASFEDMDHMDFVNSMSAASDAAFCPRRAIDLPQTVGQFVLRTVQATQSSVGKNTNLGIILLTAPLAQVPEEKCLAKGIEGVLDALTVDDSRHVFEAIRLAKPGGMGQVQYEDLSSAPTQPLREIMKLAADHDLIARQYANGFQEVLQFGLPILCEEADFEHNWEMAIIRLHLNFMASFPDSLIQRKCGAGIANESAKHAQKVLDAGWPEAEESRTLFQELDRWLRKDGNKRNPGTSADMVAATLFAAFREKKLSMRCSDEGRPSLQTAILNDP